MTTQELNYYSQFPLLFNNLTTIITLSNTTILDVGCNDWVPWWYTNTFISPAYYSPNVSTTLSVTSISRPLSAPTIIEPDVVMMQKPVYFPGLGTTYQIVDPSSYYLNTPGYSFVTYTEVGVGDDIVNTAITQQPTTNLLFITSLTVNEKKSMIDAYKTNANFIYVEDLNDFQSPSWSWYWDYLQLNFDIISDGTNGIISSK